MIEEFGLTILELSKEDMVNNPRNPVLRMYDDIDGELELLGIFSVCTGEVIENIDLADYDIRFVQKQIALNRANYLETWRDYVGFLNI